ncbi:hypothetical protein pb186bvf_005514 [Paramecium bursaria]
MNSLNQNPKKNMFYAAAQSISICLSDMLNQQSNQQSLVNMRINHFLAQFTPQNRIDSSLNHSDRNNYLKFQEKERSLSNLNKSLNNSLETKHNYNLKKFQMINEDPNLLQQKEVQKLELKDYLQKQIDENRKIKQAQQELEKIEDQKAEQRYLKQLKDLKKPEGSTNQPQVQQFQIPIKNLPIYSNVPDGPFISIYRNQSNEGNNALQKLTSIQNDLLLLQTAKNISITNINDVRQQIKQMIKKQVTPKDNNYPKNQYDRILPTETEYIPINQQLEVADLQQILQQSKPATAKANESIRKPETAQKNSSFHGSQLLKNSHLSISQITAREKSKSKSKDKMFRSNSKDRLDSLLFPNRESQKSQKISSQKEIPDITNKSFASLKAQKQDEEKQLKLVKMKQPTIPHRTSMLMQIPQKNVKQEDTLRSNYHKIS